MIGFTLGSEDSNLGVIILATVLEITLPISYPLAQGFFSSGNSIGGGGQPAGSYEKSPF